MQGQITPDEDDRHAQALVLIFVTELHPGLAHSEDMLRRLTSERFKDFSERDRIERAVDDLIGVGLLRRYDELIIPTLAALRAYEIFEDRS
jgi:hypothetical protein